MNDSIWRDIAIGAMGVLELVIIGAISWYFNQLGKRMDKQDMLLEQANKAHHENTIKLTDHSARINHIEKKVFIVTYDR